MVRSAIPDDHPYYAMIGRVTARWAQFEHVLEIAIWETLHMNFAEGSAETNRLICEQKFVRLRKVLLERDRLAQFEPQISMLEDGAGTLIAKRNRVTHDPWYVDGEGNVAQQQPNLAKKNLSFEFREVPEPELQVLLAEIDALIAEAWALRGALTA